MEEMRAEVKEALKAKMTPSYDFALVEKLLKKIRRVQSSGSRFTLSTSGPTSGRSMSNIRMMKPRSCLTGSVTRSSKAKSLMVASQDAQEAVSAFDLGSVAPQHEEQSPDRPEPESDSCSEISVKGKVLPSINNPAEKTRKMVEDQLVKAGRWNRFKDKSTGRKYILMLARWHEWWNSEEVIALRRKPLTDARISEQLLSAFCEANITRHTCGQFKAAMMILHAEALKQGGITPECRFWKDLKKD